MTPEEFIIKRGRAFQYQLEQKLERYKKALEYVVRQKDSNIGLTAVRLDECITVCEKALKDVSRT